MADTFALTLMPYLSRSKGGYPRSVVDCVHGIGPNYIEKYQPKSQE